MRRFVTACALGSLIGWGSAAHAQTRPGFEVGLSAFDYGYRERLDGATVVRDDGEFVGFDLNYVETLGAGWLVRAKLSGSAGSVDYSTPDGSRIEDVEQEIGQVELLLGHDFGSGPATITPFAGIGTRLLEDHSGGESTSDGLLGYDRRISYAYVPIGLAAAFDLGAGRALRLSGQYNWLVGGRAKSKFSELDPTLPDVTLDLDGGSGLEASALFVLPVGRRALSAGPFIRHWSIDRSESRVFTDPDGTIELFEPRNGSREIGVRIAFAF